jgi:hypothetical protein
LYVNAPCIEEWQVKYWMIFGQVIFGIFVLWTFKVNLKEINDSSLSQ